MAALVLDASAFVELLLRSEAGQDVEQQLRGSTVAVPAHFDAEVFSAMGRLARGGEIEEARVEIGLDQIARAPFRRYAVAPLLQEAWSLRHNLSLRDALYVVLAHRLGAALLTADSRLSRAPKLQIPVIVAGPS